MLHVHGGTAASAGPTPEAPGSGPASSASSATTTTPQVVAPPVHQVHGMPVAMPPQGQHYVYISMPTPQTVQNVPMGYTQTMQTVQTPVKMELGNSPSVTPPVTTTPQTPQSMPKTSKSDSKEISDSGKNDSEKSKSKKKCESVKENKEYDSSRDKDIVSDKE